MPLQALYIQVVVLETKAELVQRQWVSEETQPVVLALVRQGVAHANSSQVGDGVN